MNHYIVCEHPFDSYVLFDYSDTSGYKEKSETRCKEEVNTTTTVTTSKLQRLQTMLKEYNNMKVRFIYV